MFVSVGSATGVSTLSSSARIASSGVVVGSVSTGSVSCGDGSAAVIAIGEALSLGVSTSSTAPAKTSTSSDFPSPPMSREAPVASVSVSTSLVLPRSMEASTGVVASEASSTTSATSSAGASRLVGCEMSAIVGVSVGVSSARAWASARASSLTRVRLGSSALTISRSARRSRCAIPKPRKPSNLRSRSNAGDPPNDTGTEAAAPSMGHNASTPLNVLRALTASASGWQLALSPMAEPARPATLSPITARSSLPILVQRPSASLCHRKRRRRWPSGRREISSAISANGLIVRTGKSGAASAVTGDELSSIRSADGVSTTAASVKGGAGATDASWASRPSDVTGSG